MKVIHHYNYNHKDFSLCLSSLSLLFLLSLISFSLTTPTHADTPASSSTSANASITVANTINLTLTGGDLVIDNLTPGSASDSNIITATITSNSPYGYHLSATTGTSTGTTSLVNTADSNFVFTNLNANKASLSNFSDNTWGYSYSTDNGTSWISGDYGTALAGYNGLTLDNDDSGATGTTLYNNDSYAGSTAVKFKIGAKSATTQAAGTYTGTVNFYAVANPGPITIANATTMQEVEACPASIPLETVYTLTDPRDNQTYKVARLKDGKCWMVENLNIAGGTALSSDDTDFESTYTLPTTNGWTVNDGKLVLPASAIKNSTDNNLTDSTQFSNDNDNYAYVFNSGNKENCGGSGQNIPCYSYYSWDAATLGSGRSIGVNNVDAKQSLCPKNWRLPTSRYTRKFDATIAIGSDFYNLATSYGMETGAWNQSTGIFYIQAGPSTTPNFLLAGHYLEGVFNRGGGHYWASTADTIYTTASNSYFDSRTVDSASGGSRCYGYSVRCLFGS